MALQETPTTPGPRGTHCSLDQAATRARKKEVNTQAANTRTQEGTPSTGRRPQRPLKTPGCRPCYVHAALQGALTLCVGIYTPPSQAATAAAQQPRQQQTQQATAAATAVVAVPWHPC